MEKISDILDNEFKKLEIGELRFRILKHTNNKYYIRFNPKYLNKITGYTKTIYPDLFLDKSFGSVKILIPFFFIKNVKNSSFSY